MPVDKQLHNLPHRAADDVGEVSAAHLPEPEQRGGVREQCGRVLNFCREHKRVAVVFVLLLAGFWWMTVEMAADFYDGLAAGDAELLLAWANASLAVLFVMWGVMMLAMMLPSFVPMLLLFAKFLRQRNIGGGHLAMLLAGYSLVWLGFSFGAAWFQWAVAGSDVLREDMALRSPAARAAVLCAAGAFQFSSLKFSCLKNCRHPAFFLMMSWRSGGVGAGIMGAHYGLLCVGCCGFLMCLLFVGGVMHIGWIVLLTVYVLAEKMLPLPPRLLARAVGVFLIAAGLLQLPLF